MIFAVQLVSHLSLQYALPKSLSVAKLAVGVMATLLTVLSSETRPHFFLATLPTLPRISQAFPPLCEDIVLLLLQLGRVCTSYLTGIANIAGTDIVCSQATLCSEKQLSLRKTGRREDDILSHLKLYTQLSNAIQQTFLQIVNSTALLRHQLH
ncbi:Integrator complex subunit 2 [Lamellibrachia satsuma]|nr:Integrator complex subunit 2 [Lamellibrachia satsuma]